MSGDGEARDERTACPSCAAPVRGGALFCTQCGASLGAGAEGVQGGGARRGPSPGAAGEELWRALAPALWLWVLLLATSGGLGLLAHVQDVSSPAFDAAVTFVDAVIILLFCFANRERLRPLLNRTGLGRRTWHLPFLGFAAFWAFMWVYFLALEFLGVEDLRYLDDYEAHGWPLWSALVLIALCPAVFEELAFRGVILSRLERVMTRKEALLVQAGMFSVLHFFPLIFVSHFVLGLALGQLRRVTGSLYPGMLLHLAWNAWVVLAERLG